MVANSPIERVGPGQLDYLLNRLNEIERRLDQGGARSAYPFSVGHSGVRDFSIEPSASGDGTADILIGDGAGGKLIQVVTDPIYGTKILKFLDQQGRSMMSTDALAGYGWGTPSYPFPYQGFPWTTTLGGATSQATAKEIGRGAAYVYNPAALLNIPVRASAATAETVKVFCQFKDGQGNLNNTADQTVTLAAGVPNAQLSNFFGKNWDADDMNALCYVFIKAYVVGGTPGNVSIQCSYGEGYGISQRAYNDNAGLWAV